MRIKFLCKKNNGREKQISRWQLEPWCGEKWPSPGEMASPPGRGCQRGRWAWQEAGRTLTGRTVCCRGLDMLLVSFTALNWIYYFPLKKISFESDPNVQKSFNAITKNICAIFTEWPIVNILPHLLFHLSLFSLVYTYFFSEQSDRLLLNNSVCISYELGHFLI